MAIGDIMWRARKRHTGARAASPGLFLCAVDHGDEPIVVATLQNWTMRKHDTRTRACS